MFIWDNNNIEFVSGYLCDLYEYFDNRNNFNDNDIKQHLQNKSYYDFYLNIICQMYVKWDGDSHVYFDNKFDNEDNNDSTVYFGNLEYSKWCRQFIFVQEIANIIHRNKYKYGIQMQDYDVKELKNLLLKNYKIIII
jgi:hypothetical protein